MGMAELPIEPTDIDMQATMTRQAFADECARFHEKGDRCMNCGKTGEYMDQRIRANELSEKLVALRTELPAAPAAAEPRNDDWPECEDFYDLMQAYRHAPVTNQQYVSTCYGRVKNWMRANPRPSPAETSQASANREKEWERLYAVLGNWVDEYKKDILDWHMAAPQEPRK